jgi:CheY-like chemotaxis protein
MKLLIVDPDRDLVEMLTSWLKTLGYEVYRAYTGDRAKIEWEEQEPDPSKPTYILTVPGVGYTLIRHSLEEENYGSIEVIRTLRAIPT